MTFLLRELWEFLNGIITEWTIRVCRALLLSELYEFVWRYYWMNYKSFYDVITE